MTAPGGLHKQPAITTWKPYRKRLSTAADLSTCLSYVI
jgi:hypothetical protein